MECSFWEFVLKSGCTDIPHLQALALESILALAIAMCIYIKQSRDKNKRKRHAISEIAFQLIVLDKQRYELDVLVNQFFNYDTNVLEKIVEPDQHTMNLKSKEQIVRQIDENKIILKEKVSDFKTCLLLFSQDLPSEDVSSLYALANQILASYVLEKKSRSEVLTRLKANEISGVILLKFLGNINKKAVESGIERYNDIQNKIKDAESHFVDKKSK